MDFGEEEGDIGVNFFSKGDKGWTRSNIYHVVPRNSVKDIPKDEQPDEQKAGLKRVFYSFPGLD